MKWLWTWLVFAASVVLATDVVTLAWNPVAETSVTGYRLYAGTNSQSYFMVTNVVGRENTNCTIELPFPAAWRFAVTATNWAGLESGYSEEAAYLMALPGPELVADSYVKLMPQAEHTTNMVTWSPLALEPTLLPATNAQEFFRLTGLEIEKVKVLK